MPIRVVLAEDNYLVREGVARLLAQQPDVEVVATCDDYDSLLAAVDEHQPDVVLTDIRMPPTGTDEGVRAATEIRRNHPDTGVVVLSQWGDEDSPALVTAVESALERELSTTIMRGGAAPAIRKLSADTNLVTQGEPGDEVFLLLDGVVAVDVDGQRLAEIGPGAVLGERALLEGGTRTCTLRAVTPCKVAVAAADQLDPAALAEISTGHRREDTPSP